MSISTNPNSRFHTDSNTLYYAGVSLDTVAQQVGTPCYVYSKEQLTANYLAYRHALDNTANADKHLVCYAVKANSNLAVLNTLARLGSGFDIVSVGELERILQAGGDAGKVVFSGVAKQRHEIVRALEVGIKCFNVESPSELVRIATIAEEMNTTARCSLRVNPDVDAQTHPYISTGLKENKFGIEIESALALYLSQKDNLAIQWVGVDCHIGSQLTSISPFEDALARVLKLVDELAQQGIGLNHIDLGGGLGVVYETDDNPPAVSKYIDALQKKIGDREVGLIFEPGRSIAANAGVLLMRVDTIKEGSDKNFAIVDTAMNDMIRPALYQSYMEVLSVGRAKDSKVQRKVYDIVGPICETGDFLAKDRELSIQEGDLLCMDMAGAYGFTMASNYNSRPKAAEVMIFDQQIKVVRQRETIEDLYRGETIV